MNGSVLFAVVAYAVLAIIFRLVIIRLRKQRRELACSFRPQAENPSLIVDMDKVRTFLRHIQECRGCDRALQEALKQPMYNSKTMHSVWQHIFDDQAERLRGYIPRVQSPVSREEYHVWACHECARNVPH